MIIAIDAGNSRVKSAVYEGYSIKDLFVFDQSSIEKNIGKILNLYPKATHLVISSVSKVDKNRFLQFEKKIIVCFLTHESHFPFINNYQTPETLGLDRMVLSAGAVLQFPRQNRLVIDAGTCITYDFIDSNDCYLGGGISPGLSLRYESLHKYTAKLPLLTAKKPDKLIGNSTAEAIHSGIVNGILAEINAYRNYLSEQYSNFIIILTGGDSVFLANQLKNTIFANRNFLLDSLNQLLQYQNKNDQ